MTKQDLALENARLKQELASLQRFHDEWAPLVNALETVIQNKIDDNSYRWEPE